MILTARLQINGHELERRGIPLLSCEYNFKQDVDERGLTTGKVKGGIINLSFISIDDSEIMFWMINSMSDKSGKIVFSGEEGQRIFKTIEFLDARCIYYHEIFSRDGEMLTKISISTRRITISGTEHMNHWTNYDPT